MRAVKESFPKPKKSKRKRDPYRRFDKEHSKKLTIDVDDVSTFKLARTLDVKSGTSDYYINKLRKSRKPIPLQVDDMFYLLMKKK